MHRVQVVIYREQELWVAQALNVECSSFGNSPEEAREALREALELLYEDDSGLDSRETADARLEELVV
jgi:predicted RNase H-like HicB family nuclease